MADFLQPALAGRPEPEPPVPTHGYTEDGTPVHGRAKDHLPTHTAKARFDKALAVFITNKVGTMNCAYVFCLIAFLSLPATLAGFALFDHVFPNWAVNLHLIALVAWIAQTFIQLVLLSIIMVGQNIQTEASDARAAKTFEDTERILDAVNLETQGGLKEVLDAVHALNKTQ